MSLVALTTLQICCALKLKLEVGILPVNLPQAHRVQQNETIIASSQQPNFITISQQETPIHTKICHIIKKSYLTNLTKILVKFLFTSTTFHNNFTSNFLGGKLVLVRKKGISTVGQIYIYIYIGKVQRKSNQNFQFESNFAQCVLNYLFLKSFIF